LAIWQECGRLPCIAFEDIDLYVSRQIMQFVTDSLRQAGFLPSEGFSHIEDVFSHL
jgi:hypothetical protein